MENANGVIKKLTSAERSYYTAAEVREVDERCFRKLAGSYHGIQKLSLLSVYIAVHNIYAFL